MEFIASAKDLKKKIAAFEELIGRTPRVIACGPFDDLAGDTCWGHVTVTSVGKTKLVYQADGAAHAARISAIETFYLS